MNKRASHIVLNLDDSYGGPARSIPELMRGMTSSDWAHEVVSLRFKNDERNELVERYGLKSITFPAQLHPKLAYNGSIRDYLVSLKPDLFHCHNIWNYVPIVTQNVGTQLGIPVILSPRGTLFDWNLKRGYFKKKLYLSLFGNLIFGGAAVIHATSEEEVDAIRKIAPRSPVALIPNGVDTGEFSELGNRHDHKVALNLNSKDRHILYMGRIEEKKGLAILIEAFAAVKNQNQDWQLLVAGPDYSSTYSVFCRNLASRLGVAADVRWLGMVKGDSRRNVFGASDVFVLPTQSENYGMVIAEALSAGIPTVTTVGTPWSVIQKNGAGVIIKPVVSELVVALEQIFAKNTLELEGMAEAAREIALQNDWSRPSSEMLQVYQWVIGEGSKPDFIF
ncbi:MAG: hypothetical protein CMD99_07130 [Gammaproteobacteria bacterium]|nr:hypothetical protein [Gammaproteobacteria bacterium]